MKNKQTKKQPHETLWRAPKKHVDVLAKLSVLISKLISLLKQNLRSRVSCYAFATTQKRQHSEFRVYLSFMCLCAKLKPTSRMPFSDLLNVKELFAYSLEYLFLFQEHSIAVVSLLHSKSSFRLEELWLHVVQGAYETE